MAYSPLAAAVSTMLFKVRKSSIIFSSSPGKWGHGAPCPRSVLGLLRIMREKEREKGFTFRGILIY